MNTEELIKWSLEKGLVKTGFDKFLDEQTIEITQLGIEVHNILKALQTDSIPAEKTNIFAAEKLDESDKDQEADKKS